MDSEKNWLQPYSRTDSQTWIHGTTPVEGPIKQYIWHETIKDN